MANGLTLKVDFSDNYYKKLGLKNGNGFEDALDKGLEHSMSDAENIIKREVPRPGHSMSRSVPQYKPTGNLQRSIHKTKKQKCSYELRSNARSRGVLYWPFVNYGTSKMPANPFLTRTVNKIAPKVKEYVLEELAAMGIFD
ncbi:HK97-gp10 family putative phage morphogenesis protein [uncultured Methanobrevibacter sp.]|uniref:HK97-gp10 family putative phage morphogenesis protein n=1 Tax=uncultured Methanobrevibacter sp. TaxID=253161 RepID=UPI0025D7A291|nr:HK97-gp10 family putative phage morphogenesis protein [uncultured Methanobrevibacter sp.]